MNRDQILATLRAHEAELRTAGVQSLSLFGSVVRGEATEASDVDVLVRLTPDAAQGGFAYFARLDALVRRLRDVLEYPVDVVAEPVRKERLRRSIEKDMTLAF
jgi:uncharacterized protein